MEGPVDHARAPQRPPDDDRLKRQPGAMIPPAWKGAGVSSRVHGTLDVGRETQIAYAARASPAARRRRGTYRAVAPSISSRPVTRITFCGQTTQSGVIARNGPGAVRWRMPAVTKAAARRALAMVLAREPIGRLTRTGEGGHARTPGPTDRRRTAVSESAFGSDAFVRSRGLFGPISAPGDYIAMSIAETGENERATGRPPPGWVTSEILAPWRSASDIVVRLRTATAPSGQVNGVRSPCPGRFEESMRLIGCPLAK